MTEPISIDIWSILINNGGSVATLVAVIYLLREVKKPVPRSVEVDDEGEEINLRTIDNELNTIRGNHLHDMPTLVQNSKEMLGIVKDVSSSVRDMSQSVNRLETSIGRIQESYHRSMGELSEKVSVLYAVTTGSKKK